MGMTHYGIQYIAKRPAWAAMWWSVLMPGFGHLYVGHTLVGLVLLGWELVINVQANLNLAIYHSILGEYARATEVLQLEWAIMYPFIYLFAMFDAYRLAVEHNNLCQLEELQRERDFTRASLNPLGSITYLDRRNPLTAAFFSVFIGGLGHIYNLRLPKAVILSVWHVSVMILSNGHKAVLYTLLGRFHEAAAVVDYQWLLFWPSIAIFNIVNAYKDTVESNNLYDDEWHYRMHRYIRNPPWPDRLMGPKENRELLDELRRL